MQEKIISATLLIVGIIHIIPVTGVIGLERLAVLYGIDISDANLEILMRHRAILFGLVGLIFIYAAFNSSIQPLAFVIAFVSIVSFFWLVISVGNYNSSIVKVIIADVIAFVSLAIGVVIYLIKMKFT